MITKFLVVSVGFILSRFSLSALEFQACFLARVFLLFPSKRKRLLFSNLTHAFPKWSNKKVHRIAFQSSVCLFEMGFFSLVYPHLRKFDRKATLSISESVETRLFELRKDKKPLLILIPHFALFESIATSQVLRPFKGRKLGAIYRPNSNEKIDEWVNQSRKRLGLKTFSRKKGLIQAKKHMDSGSWVALLFDQNAGLGGELSLFMDRLCSVTPLPDILLKRTSANVILAVPFRKSFFRSELKIFNLDEFKRSSVSSVAHAKLEFLIKNDSNGLPEWLWSHGRWKTQDHFSQIFHIHSKRTQLINLNKFPKKLKIWIRMPNWLGDFVMAIPLIKAIQAGRPDAEITLLCQEQFVGLSKFLDIDFSFITLPEKGILYYFKFLKFRKNYPDVHFLFTNSLRGDIEAFICGAKLRLGGSVGSKRKLLTNQSFVSKDFKQQHLTKLWHEYLKSFGLKEPVDFHPILSKAKHSNKKNQKIICIAPGSSNTPKKRWPVPNWIKFIKELIHRCPEYEIKLVGTNNDKMICDEILNCVKSSKVEDLCGKTSIIDLCKIFGESTALVCNDSGAMHLANAIGIKVYAIFGITSASITGPIFLSHSQVFYSNRGDEDVFSALTNALSSDLKF